MGVVLTMAVKHTTAQIGGLNLGSCGASTFSLEVQQKLVTMESQLQALYVYIAMKEGGKMPEELVALFPNLAPQVYQLL